METLSADDSNGIIHEKLQRHKGHKEYMERETPMSHHHDPHHHHNHPGDDHHHHHSHVKGSEMSMEEKLTKLLEHWLQHNEEHAKSYELWAERAASHGLADVSTHLESVAEKTRAIDEDFKAALTTLKKRE